MSKDYEIYEPWRDWDPFVEREELSQICDKNAQLKVKERE